MGTPLSEAFVRIRPEGNQFGQDLVREVQKSNSKATAAGKQVGAQLVAGTSPALKDIGDQVAKAVTKAVPGAAGAAKKVGAGIGAGIGKGVEPGVGRIPKTVQDQVEKAAAGNERAFVRVGTSIGSHIKLGVGEQLGGLKGVVAGAIAGAGLVEGIDRGLEQVGSQANLAAKLGLSPEESVKAGKVAGRLYGQNFGDSLDTVNDAVARVTQDIGISLNSVDLEPVTGKVLNLAQVMGEDVGGVTTAVGQLIRTGLVKDASEGIDVITRGFQSGANRAGDLLDTLTEYPTQFRDLGLSGQQSIGLVTQGLKAGARDADIVADALKEFAIRSKDGSDTTAAGFKAIGLNADRMARIFTQGGPAAAKALDTVLDRIREMPDPVKRSRTAVALFGTQAEDTQRALFALDPSTAVQALGKVGGAADKMGKTLSDNAAGQLQAFKRRVSQTFSTTAATVVTTVAGMVPKVKAGMGGVVDAIRTGSADAGGALGTVEGVAANVSNTVAVLFGHAIAGEAETGLTRFASAVNDRFAPTVAAVAHVITGDVIPAVSGLVDRVAGAAPPFVHLAVFVGTVALAVGRFAVALASKVLPVVVRLTGPVFGALVAALGGVLKALSATLGFVEDHSTVFAVIAGAITALFLPAMIAAGVQAVISGGLIVASWVAQGAAAVASAAETVAIWALLKASAIQGALAQSAAVVSMVAGWVAAGVAATAAAVKVVAGWVITGAAAAAAGVVMAAAVARMVAGWVLMGVQALLGAAKVAAAWVIAMGPIGLVVAAVVGLVVLIVKNWDAIWGATKRVWSAVSGAVSSAWHAITGFVSSGVSRIVGFITGLPGRIVSLGGQMLGAGKALIGKLFDGLVNAGRAAGSFAANLGRTILNKIIDGLNAVVPHSIGIHINAGPLHFNENIPLIPRIPHFARGGRFGPGFMIVGEEGPELLQTDTTGMVTDARQTDRFLHSGQAASTAAAAPAMSAADVEAAVYRGFARAIAEARVRIDQLGYVTFHQTAVARIGGV